ncbi:MAG: sulfite exporter TauE/SafE family protein [Pseudomonadota bacterium]
MFGLELITPTIFVLACGVAFVAGLVKGIVGFAMPMLMVSGLGSFLPPELAVAALIGPTVLTNGMQSFRQGGRAAWDSLTVHRRYLIIAGVVLVLSAQLVGWIDGRVMLAILGGPIVLFGFAQLAGWSPRIYPQDRTKAEVGFGLVSGFFGGLAGVWGPAMVVYLTALGTPKQEQVRVQGVAFGLGGLLLLLAHIQSGVITFQTAQFSAVLCVPALIGMWMGLRVQDRLDQALFRRLTLIVLIFAGLNLLRRAIFG